LSVDDQFSAPEPVAQTRVVALQLLHLSCRGIRLWPPPFQGERRLIGHALEGIAKAKAAGVYKGRPPSIEASRVRELKAQGMRPTDIAKALKIGRASVYRVLGTAPGA
jgi:hypothetical protein